MMKTVRRTALLLAAVTAFAAPSGAHAQGMFGKLKSLAGQGSQLSGDVQITGDEAGQFLALSLKSTKNVMISTLLLARALDSRQSLTLQKAKVGELRSISDFKEIEAHRTSFASDLDALNKRQDLAAAFEADYKARSPGERKVLAIALTNLLIGVARNAELATKAPGMVSAVSRNPQLLTRVGQFKAAAKMLTLQGKGFASMSKTFPALLAAAKVKAPADPKASDMTDIPL